MTDERKEIILILSMISEKCSSLRMAQIMFNLDITEHHDKIKHQIENKIPQTEYSMFRDNYNDSDKRVLDRMKNSSLYKEVMSETAPPNFAGQRVCKGSFNFGTNCGNCAKCKHYGWTKGGGVK